ncbi:MAG TPA: DUF1778 domain-containing protein [Stenomitos sp.]
MTLSQDHRSNRSSTVNLRIEPEMRDIIDAAAKLRGKSRTAFVLDAAHQEAQDTLLDQRLFRLNEQQWDAFTQALDAPPSVNGALAEVLATPAPWE